MTKTNCLLTGLFLTLILGCNKTPDNILNTLLENPVNSYQEFSIQGFDIYIEDLAFEENEAISNVALDLMEKSLIKIVNFNF